MDKVTPHAALGAPPTDWPTNVKSSGCDTYQASRIGIGFTYYVCVRDSNGRCERQRYRQTSGLSQGGAEETRLEGAARAEGLWGQPKPTARLPLAMSGKPWLPGRDHTPAAYALS